VRARMVHVRQQNSNWQTTRQALSNHVLTIEARNPTQQMDLTQTAFGVPKKTWSRLAPSRSRQFSWPTPLDHGSDPQWKWRMRPLPMASSVMRWH